MYDQEMIPPPSSNGQMTVLSPTLPAEPIRSSVQGLSENDLPRLLERYAERQALSMLWAANFTQCLLQNQIAPQIEIRDARGQTLTLHGKDLYNETTWRKFLTATPLSERILGSLVEGSQEVLRHYRTFLVTAYTRRYQALARPEHLHWFHQVTYLAVIRRIMETKYGWSATRHQPAFADGWVAHEMEKLMLLNQLATEIAKAIHHIVKEPKEQATHLIEHLYQVHAGTVLQHLNVPSDPLPPLPQGTPLPLARFSEGQELPLSLQATQEAHDEGQS
jgi:hypothetical protein